MQAAPVTAQSTSSTNWLSSKIIRVLEILPPISAPEELPEYRQRAHISVANRQPIVRRIISTSQMNSLDQSSGSEGRRRWCGLRQHAPSRFSYNKRKKAA